MTAEQQHCSPWHSRMISSHTDCIVCLDCLIPACNGIRAKAHTYGEVQGCALDSDLLTKIYQRSFRYGTNEDFSTRMAELPVIPSNLGVSLL